MENNNNFRFRISGLPSNEIAYENSLFMNTKDFTGIKSSQGANPNSKVLYIKLNNQTFGVREYPGVEGGIYLYNYLYNHNYRLSINRKTIQRHV